MLILLAFLWWLVGFIITLTYSLFENKRIWGHKKLYLHDLAFSAILGIFGPVNLIPALLVSTVDFEKVIWEEKER